MDLRNLSEGESLNVKNELKRILSNNRNYPFRGVGGFGYKEYHNSANSDVWHTYFNAKKHRLSEKNNPSHRTINHWEKQGLLSDDRNNGIGWRKYSLIDIIWIHIIGELRKFGYSLECIKKVRDFLIIDKQMGSDYPYLEYMVASSMVFQRPTFVMVFSDEDIEITPGDGIEESLWEHGRTSDSYILISINKILQRLFPEIDFDPAKANLALTKQEEELLLMLRTGEFESITVQMKGDNIELIDRTENLPAKKRLHDIINESKYQEVTFKLSNGKVTSIKRKETVKPTKPESDETSD